MDGSFSITDLPSGEYCIVINGKPNAQYLGTFTVKDRNLKLDIVTENVLFEVSVVNSDGIAVQASELGKLHFESTEPFEYWLWPHPDKEGKFSFGRIQPGNYNLFVDDTFVQQFEIPAGKDLTNVVVTIE